MSTMAISPGLYRNAVQNWLPDANSHRLAQSLRNDHNIKDTGALNVRRFIIFKSVHTSYKKYSFYCVNRVRVILTQSSLSGLE